MGNDAQEMWDACEAEAKSRLRVKELYKIITPIVEEINSDPYSAALSMIRLQKRVFELERELAEAEAEIDKLAPPDYFDTKNPDGN